MDNCELLRENAQKKIADGDLTAAGEILNQAFQTYPDDMPLLIDIIKLSLKTGKYSQADLIFKLCCKNNYLHSKNNQLNPENKDKTDRSKYHSELSELYTEFVNLTQDLPICLPDNLPYDIAFIMSYPRSGNTYMREVLAYLTGAIPGDQYFSYHSYSFNSPAKSSPFPMFFKEHDFKNYHKKFRIIYIVRDGRDVMLSLVYFTWREKLHNYIYPGQLADAINVISASNYGSWTSSITTATQLRKVKKDIIILRYEDIMKSPELIASTANWFHRGCYYTPQKAQEAMDLVEKVRVNRSVGVKDSGQWGYDEEIFNRLEGSYLLEWAKNRTKSNWQKIFDKKAMEAMHNTGATEYLMAYGYEDNPDWWK